MSLLTLKNLNKSFGRQYVVKNFNLSLNENEIRCIIGPNGAGKTTLFNLITGRLSPDNGNIFFAGENITSHSTSQIIRKGMSRSFQVSNFFPTLTVFQNIRIAALSRFGFCHIFYRPVNSLKSINDEVDSILSTFQMKHLSNTVAEKLSHGDRRKLEICLVMMLKPKLILLDEPTAGMNRAETQDIIQLIKDLVEKQSLTLLLTEHDMHVVFSLSQRITFMHYGEVVCEGSPDEIKDHKDVQAIYLGGEV